MRLIDADALIEKCKDIVFKYPDGTEYRHRCVDPDVIREMPTIKPEDRTAKTEYRDADGEYLCGKCGRVVFDYLDSYCPSCGARLE